MMDIRAHNRIAWDALAERGDQWTVPVSPQKIEEARQGRWTIVLTPIKPVPREWLDIAGQHVLCLASGGGQQAPILAAAGATVTVLDNSPKQLESDARMAERHGLAISTVLGDMANLHMFADAAFDLIVHPVSNCFVPDVRPVWREAFRVLRARRLSARRLCQSRHVYFRSGSRRSDGTPRGDSIRCRMRTALARRMSRWNSATRWKIRSAVRLPPGFPSRLYEDVWGAQATAIL